MVKPTIQVAVKQQKVKASPMMTGMTLINEIKSNTALREKTLLNTANRLASKYGRVCDVTYKGVTESGKSFKLAFDGKESTSKYIVVNTKVAGKIEPCFISAKALWNKNNE